MPAWEVDLHPAEAAGRIGSNAHGSDAAQASGKTGVEPERNQGRDQVQFAVVRPPSPHTNAIGFSVTTSPLYSPIPKI